MVVVMIYLEDALLLDDVVRYWQSLMKGFVNFADSRSGHCS